MITTVQANKSGVEKKTFALYKFSPIDPSGNPMTSAATALFQHKPSEVFSDVSK